MSVRLFAGVSLAVVTIAAALAGWLAAEMFIDGGSGAAAPYNPTVGARYCNALSGTFPGGTSDPALAGSPGCADPAPVMTSTAYPLTVTHDLAGGNSLAGSPYFTLLSSDHSVAADAAIANGTKVGGVTQFVTLSLLNGTCSTVLTTDFVLYDSTTTGGTVSPLSEPTANRFLPLVNDDNSDGSPSSIADNDSPFVTSDVSFFPTWLDPDLSYPGGPNGGTAPVAPRARYSGGTLILGEWQFVSVLEFDATALAAFNTDTNNAPHPLGRVSRTPNSDRLSVMAFGDPTASQDQMSPVSHRCAPLSTTTMLLGTPPTSPARLTTPATGGTRAVGEYGFNQRDTDGDGIENPVDTCDFMANTGSDPDSDGLDNACDPTPVTDTGFGDHDGDLLDNREDTCPLVSNSGTAQRDTENLTAYSSAAADGGPKRDYLGDACDANDTAGDGAFVEDYDRVAKCIDAGPQVDADLDGYCSTQDLDDTNAATPGFTLNVGSDMDGTAGAGDTFGANRERYVGTDPTRRCAATSTRNDEPVDSSPADFDDDGRVNMIDFEAFRPYFGMAVPPAPARYDITPSKTINISDMLAMLPLLGGICPSFSAFPLPSEGPIGSVELDTDVSGNDARLTGGASVQTCGATTTSGTIQVDIVVPAPGIDASDGLSGWQFELHYNPAILEVQSVDYSQLLVQVAGSSSPPANFGDSAPDTNGVFLSRVLDLASPASPEPGGKDEVGPGVLARITLEGVGAGQSALVLQKLNLTASDGDVIGVTSVPSAAVAVDGSCTPPTAGDADNDGIEDSNDSSPLTPSTGFFDEHGILTTGDVNSTGGATVEITDAPDTDPDESRRGVEVTVSGAGGPVVIDFCGEEMELTPPASAILTCGSAWLWIESGQVILHMGSFIGIMDAVSAARLSRPIPVPGVYNVYSHQFSQHDIYIGGLYIGPDTLVTYIQDPDEDSLVDQADNCPTVSNVSQDNSDGDTFGNACDNCPSTTNQDQANTDGDQQGNACDACPSTATLWMTPTGDEGDCDGFTLADETSITTDPNDACGFTPGGDPASETWPPDLVETEQNKIDISDVLALKPVFGMSGPARYNIVPAGTINISDVLVLKPFFGKSCTP